MKAKTVKSQSFLEYAVLIGVVVGVLIAMRVYMVRAVQEKYRESADVFGSGEQYAKGLTQVTNSDEPGTGIPESTPNVHITCPQATANVAKLGDEIKTLRDQAESMLVSAAQTEASLPMLQAQADALTYQANQNDIWARNERQAAADLTAQADDKQKQVDDYKKNNLGCFNGGCATSCADGDSCCCLLDAVAQLESEAANLRTQAAQHIAAAVDYEAKAKDLHAQADSLNGSILKLKEQISNLRSQADDFNTRINQKQAEIGRYKKDYPDCF